MTRGNTGLNAVIGAAITLGLLFTSISPLLGGAVAGYLQHEPPARGARVGAISGLLATLPLLLIMGLGMTLFAGLWPMHMTPFGGLGFFFVWFVMFPILLIWFVGLSAVGGYLGAYLNVGPANAA